MHWTPKHGSWLNMAEIEIGLLGRTCLDRRIGSVVVLEGSSYRMKDRIES